ncbi:hypothetical protein [Streptomyces sp. NPDC056632]|uniref:hypothetical protein n=1 Tax=Streptomyces sp. NPDC056632 TaxID=3345884 RepID=UPI00369DF5B1
MAVIAQNYDASLDGIKHIREGAGVTRQIVELAVNEVVALGQTGSMSGPAYVSFLEVATEWERLMRAEIDRLNEFADKSEYVVKKQIQDEFARAGNITMAVGQPLDGMTILVKDENNT